MVKTTFQPANSGAGAPTPESTYDLSSAESRQRPWRRFLIGGICLALGLMVVGIGAASILYRLTHITVKGGLVNGRAVRIQAPVDGTIQDFYARPGVQVRAGQILAQLQPLPVAQKDDDSDTLVQLEQTNQTTVAKLAAAQQTLTLLNQQLRELELQGESLQTATAAIADENVTYSKAAVDAAIAQEEAARVEYERFRSLLETGAVSEQEVDELEAVWRSAKAEVEQAKTEQNVAQVTVDALAQQTPIESNIEDLQSEQLKLLRDIQTQTVLVSTLQLELQSQQQQLAQFSANQDDGGDSPALVTISAPFDGVVYGTQHDVGEQVNRPMNLLSLLDCNDLWVEALVGLEQAKRIDADQPVRVQLAGYPRTLVGEVELISATSAGDLTQARTEALLPAIPSRLIGQPLTRVRVKIPPTSVQNQAEQFCGIGQSAKLTFGTQSSVAQAAE